MTIFVTLQLIFAPKAFCDEADGPFTAWTRLGGQDAGTANGRMAATWVSEAEYDFYKTIGFGADVFYFRRTDKVGDDQNYKGFDDVGVFVGDSKLWSNEQWGTSIGLKLAFFAPSSWASQIATQKGEYSQSVNLHQKFTDKWSFDYYFQVAEFDFVYDSFTYNDTVLYNVLYRLTDKAGITYNIEKDAHINFSVTARNYYLTENQQTDIYGFMTTISYDVNKNASIDFGVAMAFKDNGPDIWNGPTYSDEPWGADGVYISFGTKIKI